MLAPLEPIEPSGLSLEPVTGKVLVNGTKKEVREPCTHLLAALEKRLRETGVH